ncbi:MAG: double zinc ribbon domain-containing protein [Candidatus Helarchaeota archaeon]
MILLCEKCNEPLSITDARIRRDFALIKTICPECRKKFKKQLHPDEIDLKDFQKQFYSCEFCGSANVKIRDERKVNDQGRTDFEHFTTLPPNQTGIHVTCLDCRKTKRKISEYRFLKDIEEVKTEEKETKTPQELVEKKREIIVCPTCDAQIDGAKKFCDICGQELYCDECKEYIRAGAGFCHGCGKKVQAGTKPDVAKKPKIETSSEKVVDETMEPPKERFEKAPKRTCPHCDANLDDSPAEILFCPKCGQRLKCAQCGSDLAEGAHFCFVCGKAV